MSDMFQNFSKNLIFLGALYGLYVHGKRWSNENQQRCFGNHEGAKSEKVGNMHKLVGNIVVDGVALSSLNV